MGCDEQGTSIMLSLLLYMDFVRSGKLCHSYTHSIYTFTQYSVLTCSANEVPVDKPTHTLELWKCEGRSYPSILILISRSTSSRTFSEGQKEDSGVVREERPGER